MEIVLSKLLPCIFLTINKIVLTPKQITWLFPRVKKFFSEQTMAKESLTGILISQLIKYFTAKKNQNNGVYLLSIIN